MTIEVFIFYIFAFFALFFVLKYIGRFFSFIAGLFSLNRRNDFKTWH